MRAIEAAKAHFKLQSHSTEVPEWGEGGRPLKVFWTPLTLMERNKLFKGGAADLSTFADLLIMKARDEGNQPMFTLEDKQDLLRSVDSNVLSALAAKIMASPSVDEAEKN